MSSALDDYSAPTLPEPPSDEDLDRVRFYQRRVAVLEQGNRERCDLLADAVAALHEVGAHEEADRIERLADAF